jgi:predicted enzyme related to lactoylglutathione lyase
MSQNLVDPQGRFVWYELATTDADSAKAFYAGVMGWGTRDMSIPGTNYTLFTVREAPVSGLIHLPDEARRRGARPRWLGYVGVDDVDATADRIKHLGGAVLVPPTNVLDVSRFAVVADPQMATFGLITWSESGQERQTERTAPGRVGWHELLAADREKALSFYGAALGWQRAAATKGRMGTYQLFSAGSETVGGIVTKPRTVSVPSWVYYFNVDDIDVKVKRVADAGGHVVEGPIEIPSGSWVVHCTDPQSAMFALVGKRSYKAIIRFGSASARTTSGAVS